MKKASWFILFLLMGVSCLDQPDCFRQNLNLVGISFKKMFDGQADTVYIVKITSPDTENPGYQWYDTTLVTSLSLPVNFFSKLSTTTFNIERNVDGDILENSMQVSYKSKTQFVSTDCGERFLITDLAAVKTTKDFDSIRFVSGELSNPAHTNIVVYRCPKTNYVKLIFRQLFMDGTFGQPEVRFLDSIVTDNLHIAFKNTGVSSVRLPLNEQADNTTFRFVFHDGTVETLTLNYTSQSKTLFNLCGPQQFHKLADTANIHTTFRKDFQLFRVIRDSLFDPPLTNIQVTRCPQNNLINVLFKRISDLGGSTFRDSVLLKSVTADYPTGGDLLAGIDGKVTNLTLPLNPDNAITSTTFYFDIDSASTIKRDTLKLSYTVGNPVLYHVGCPAISPISALQIDNTTFNIQTRVADTNVKFPTSSNIEIIQ